MAILFIVNGRLIKMKTPALMLATFPTPLDDIVSIVIDASACRNPRSVKARAVTLRKTDIGIRYGNFFKVRIHPRVMFENLGKIGYSGRAKHVERMLEILFGENLAEVAGLMLIAQALYTTFAMDNTANEILKRIARSLAETIASRLHDASCFYTVHAIFTNSYRRLFLYSNRGLLPEAEPDLICRASKVAAYVVKMDGVKGGKPGSIVATNIGAIKSAVVYASTFPGLSSEPRAYIYTRDKGEVYGIVANPDVDINAVVRCIDEGRVVCV